MSVILILLRRTMSKPVWKGFISFGLVAIPIQLKSMEQKQHAHFHLLDNRDKSRIRYQRVNMNTEEEVPWSEVVKAYEIEKNHYIVLKDEDFNQNLEKKDHFNSIEITEFVNSDEIPSFYYEKPYYIIPDSKNHKAYVLLREALKKTKTVGIGKVMIRTKEYLSVIMPYQEGLILDIIRYQQNLREEEQENFPQESLKKYHVTDQEIKMAVALINEMTSDWNPEQYHDVEQETLMKWIEHHQQTQLKDSSTHKKTKRKEVVDFMTLLKKSMTKKKLKKPNAEQKNS